MVIRHDGYCQALNREIEIKIEYIEVSDLSSASRVFRKGLATCPERINHSCDQCKGCAVTSKAPEFISMN